MSSLPSLRRILLGGLLGLVSCGFTSQTHGQVNGNASVSQPAGQYPLSVQIQLGQAQAAFKAGDYELADKRYCAVLNADSSNGAGRRGIAGIMAAKGASGVRPNEAVYSTTPPGDDPGTKAIRQKLKSISIPFLEVHDMSLNDVCEAFRRYARMYDTDPDEDERGVNIFLKLPSQAPMASAPGLPPEAEQPATASPAEAPSCKTPVTLTLSRVSLLEALQRTAASARLRIGIEPYAVSFVPLAEDKDELYTREYRVPLSFFPPSFSETATLVVRGRSGSIYDDGPASSTIDAKNVLEASGVTFPSGASAVYLPLTSRLVVRNTRTNVGLIKALCDEAVNSPQPASTP